MKCVRKTKDAGLARRCLIVLSYGRGLGCTRTADAVVCAPSTAIEVTRRFMASDVDGLVDRRVDNGERKDDDDLRAALAALLVTRPVDHGWQRSTWSRELMRLTLAELGFEVSDTTVGRALDGIGARWKAGKPIVLCPWGRVKKNRRLNRLKRLIDELPKNEVLLYEDEIDIHLNPKVGRDWALPGDRPVVVTPGKNRKHYVAGAMDAKTKELVWVAAERKNGDLFIALLARLAEVYAKKRRIHLILDNFIIHSSKKVRRALELYGDKFVLHFLPPYCPDHNRIERLWLDLHTTVTRNHRWPTIEQLMAQVSAWLNRLPGQRTGAGLVA